MFCSLGAIIKSNRDRKSLLQHPEHAAEESRWLRAEKRQLDLVMRRHLTGTFQEAIPYSDEGKSILYSKGLRAKANIRGLTRYFSRGDNATRLLSLARIDEVHNFPKSSPMVKQGFTPSSLTLHPHFL